MSCAVLNGQCGGKDYTGPTNCCNPSMTKCEVQGPYYSQCKTSSKPGGGDPCTWDTGCQDGFNCDNAAHVCKSLSDGCLCEPKSTPAPPSKCGDHTYDPSADLCCEGNLYVGDKKSGGTCCGSQAITDPGNYNCCNGTIYQNKELGCCGNKTLYDFNKKFCCHNEIGIIGKETCCASGVKECNAGGYTPCNVCH